MKKGFVLLLCCVLLCMNACASMDLLEETVPATLATTSGFSFQEGTEVCGVSIGGMSPEAAMNAISKKVSDYELDLTVNGVPFVFTGEDMDVSFDEERFRSWTGNGDQPDVLLRFDDEVVRKTLEAVLECEAVDSAVVFSREEDAFVCLPSSKGRNVDLDAVMTAVEQAVLHLQSDIAVAAEEVVITPALTETDTNLINAKNTANAYLQTVPEYVYFLDRGETITEPLTREMVASFILVGEDFSVAVDATAVERYAAQMANQYSCQARTGDFLTTDGKTVPFAVDYDGRCVDETALAADIYMCLTAGIGGKREAPYSLQANVVELPFGGNYIEIDLTAQKLWVYKNGTCVVESPIVSGCVAEGKFTPNGVYAVYEREKDCWLTGPTWNDFVEYWLAFYKSFGLHDASWRSEFGGDIYLYEGSHGCPNLPPELADDVYNNAPLGTKVILYGGETVAEQLSQEITGTAAYDLKMGNEPFVLDVKLKYPEAELRYRSSNPQVVSVAADGTVTVEGPGSAVVTVVAAGFSFHSGASMPIQIRVTP